MKTLITLLSASAFISTMAFAETAVMNQEKSQIHNETQSRFHTMKTDELLEKRGTMTTQQDREQLHNELMSRQQTMTKEEKEKFMQRPENRTPKMKNMGQGQGMMQGQGNGMGSGGGMGKGMGGR
ncbi:MAG: hypothetical protein M0P91_11420 [Sulfuricurvum sp.]|jgi:hypothetical protein|uniref:hypothetical protein n=1 Tax=Sulfuricurvum sp. TaxID=2025608 RepID=UPI0025CC1EBA|nr:hypothetical protein [Sulfuricurvum sp.]MCK9373801.1 hypothetical protein [Sulfuricurvum sp.]